MLINFLPHRSQPLPPARRRWQQELGVTWVAAGVVGASLGVWQQDALQAQHQQARTEALALTALQQEHTTLRQDVARLNERLQQLQTLQGVSTQALAMLQAWVPALPPGMVVQSLKQEPVSQASDAWLVQGVAPHDDSVARWLQHLPQPLQGELLELRSTPWPQGAGRVPVQHFTVRLQLAGR
jgi:Tfp pilus assembly protein PilN